jgi:DNA-directed RNA polymerase specialized sigma24 family protein
MTTTTTACRTEHRHLSARLDREWEQLCRRPAVVERAQSWQVTATPFSSLGELLRLAGYRVAPTPEADEVLRRLVLVAADDPLAARIVLQRILPGLLVIVRREQLRDRDVDALDVLAAEAWLAIVTYRADVRRNDVAAKLLNDARHRAFTNPRRRQDHTREDVVAPGRLDLPRLPQPGSSFEELTMVLRDARRDGLPDADLAIVRDYLSGATASELAAAGNVTARTLRNRRRRSIEKIRQLAA